MMGAILSLEAGVNLKSLRNFGIAIFLVGVAMGYTLWASGLSEFMYLEDLGLETSEAGIAARRTNPGERLLSVISALLSLGGVVVVLLSIFLSRKNRDGSL